MKNLKFVFWWDSPCKGMINVLKYACEEYSPESIAITGDTGNYRKSMGWCDVQECFNNHIIVQEANWIEDTTRLFNKYHDYIHVFNGITRKYFIHLIDRCCSENVPFFIMSEAYSNLEFGLKKVIKNIYINCYLPFKVRPIAKKSLGVFCLSGKKKCDLKQFNHLGFSKKRIVPFGYWTEPSDYKYSKRDNKLHILCPGVLKKYKGVDLLIKAISLLNKEGKAENFVVHITGNGVEKEHLLSMVHKEGLENIILFHGALNEEDYQELLSYIDILVAPGYVEPWGIRINEAIQRGQIVICSDGLGAYYLINESKGGEVFKSGDANELSEKIYQICSLSSEQINELKLNNINYSKNISCHKKAEELYGNLCKLMQL